MKFRVGKVLGICVVGVVVIYVAFMAGRYSYLFTEPEVFLNKDQTWMVRKAREYAREEGISETRLKTPKVIETVRVYFGGMAGNGGVEVTMMKENGRLVQISH